MSTRTLVNFWLDVSSLLVMLCMTMTGGIMYFVLPPGTGHSHHLFGLGRHDFGTIHFYLAVTAVILLALHVMMHWSWICGVIARALGRPKPSPRVQRAWGWSVLVGLPALIALALWWASGQVERSSETLLARGEHAVQPQRTDVRQGEHGKRRQAVDEPREEVGHDEAGALAKADPEAHQGAEEVAHERQPRPRRRPRAVDKRSEDCPAGAAINGQTTLSAAARACGLSVQQMRDRLGLPASASPGERLGRLKRWHGFDIHAVRRLACQG
jgi:hypothetical protein